MHAHKYTLRLIYGHSEGTAGPTIIYIQQLTYLSGGLCVHLDQKSVSILTSIGQSIYGWCVHTSDGALAVFIHVSHTVCCTSVTFAYYINSIYPLKYPASFFFLALDCDVIVICSIQIRRNILMIYLFIDQILQPRNFSPTGQSPITDLFELDDPWAHQ